MTHPTDPMELLVYNALEKAGVWFTTDQIMTRKLDFYVIAWDVYVEVKRLHSDRISDQMARANNVIVLQGETAVRLFCHTLTRCRP